MDYLFEEVFEEKEKTIIKAPQIQDKKISFED